MSKTQIGWGDPLPRKKDVKLATEFHSVKVKDLIRQRSRSCELYHISFDAKLPLKLDPQLPAGSELAEDKPDSWGSEPNIPRVCLGETLEGCVRAVFVNVQEILEKHGNDGVKWYVYRVVSKKGQFVSPQQLASSGAVHDALATGEWWSLNPVELEPFGVLEVKVDTEADWLEYKLFGYGDVMEHSPKTFDLECTKVDMTWQR